MRLTGAEVFDPRDGFVPRDVCVEEDKFAASSPDAPLDVSGCYIIPGLTDLHFHGCAGADISDGDAAALQTIADYELRRGVTQICPAVMTLPEERLFAVCRNAADFRERAPQGAELVGVSLEGPFLSPARKGAQNGAWLRAPDAALLLRLREASGGLVKLVTIAPEEPGALDFIRQVRDVVTVSIGHTAAGYDQALAAFEAGARQITHLCNGMNPFHHRAPGPVLAAAESDCMAELICDGAHVHPAVVRAVFRLFGRERVILISDTMRAAGMPDGAYELGGQSVMVRHGQAALTGGTLAGAVTDLMGGMKNAVSFGIPLADAVTAAAVNPAKALGIYDRFGSLDPGKTANAVVLDGNLSPKAVIFRGRVVSGAL